MAAVSYVSACNQNNPIISSRLEICLKNTAHNISVFLCDDPFNKDI